MLTQQARELVIETVMNVNPALITAIAVGMGAGGSHHRDVILRIKATSFQRKGSRVM
jgi:tartrate dehydratase alpha subunit/fumarate hydratase class I-like protein